MLWGRLLALACSRSVKTRVRKRGPKRAMVRSIRSMLAPLSAIRPATAADVPDLLRLVRALADYEKEPDAATASRIAAPIMASDAGSLVRVPQ